MDSTSEQVTTQNPSDAGCSARFAASVRYACVCDHVPVALQGSETCYIGATAMQLHKCD